jgi:hypothetical protein
MFKFLAKYALDVEDAAHWLANVIEEDGPLLVSALRTAGSLIPGIKPFADAGAAVATDAEIVAEAAFPPPARVSPNPLRAPASAPVAAPVAPPAVAPAPAAPANPNPLRLAAAIAAVDAEIAAGKFDMPTEDAPLPPPGSWHNPLRG